MVNKVFFVKLRALVLVLCFGVVATNVQIASAGDAYINIEKANWIAKKRYIKVKAKGRVENSSSSDLIVSIYNADTGMRIKRKEVSLEDDGRWELETKRRLSRDSAPCRIRIEADGVSVERDVNNAPTRCFELDENTTPVAHAGQDQSIVLEAGQLSTQISLDASASTDADGSVVAWIWSGSPDPADVIQPQLSLSEGEYSFTLQVVDNDGASSKSDVVVISIIATPPPPPMEGVSINSTSVNGEGGDEAVAQASFINNGDYALLAANDLGMHCADLDYRVFSILPPFNVMHAQVIRKGGNGSEPKLEDDSSLEVIYSAASNPNDPALAQAPQSPVFKGNFWDDEDGDGQTLGFDSYAPLFFGLLKPTDMTNKDTGLPVPDSILLRDCLSGYLTGAEGAEGPRANCGLVQAHLPGKAEPYVANEPVAFDRFDREVNFFNELLSGLGLGGIISDTNWFAADGVPMLPVDDAGRSNAYPIMRVQARHKDTGEVVATTDMVVPVASEADCQGCHATPIDCESTTQSTGVNFNCNGLAVKRTSFDVMTLDGDSSGALPPGDTPLEMLSNVAKVNILRLHDAKHGTDLNNNQPIQCSTCHYSPALDLAQLGPTDSPATEQTSHITMSRAMHGHHGELKDDQGNLLFPDMPNPQGRSQDIAQEILGETCYQCHPGKRTQCLRGAMAKGGVTCQDCHGEMRHVGNDFSENMAETPWPAGANLNKRVPWAKEPNCGACHTGDAVNNLAGHVGVPVADDGIRLLQAYTIKAGLDAQGSPDGTEVTDVIDPSNKRFAENETLYRLSKGHGGVMCEGCHGSTHAIFPNPNPAANDNVTMNQLQGHSGTLVECQTCHKNSLGLTLDGPHGMHPVNDSVWRNKHEDIAEDNANACRTCHGQNGEGTVLSKTATARRFVCEEGEGSLCTQEGQTVEMPKGTEVNCAMCHENKLN